MKDEITKDPKNTMMAITLEEYKELIEIKGRYLELRDQINRKKKREEVHPPFNSRERSVTYIPKKYSFTNIDNFPHLKKTIEEEEVSRNA